MANKMKWKCVMVFINQWWISKLDISETAEAVWDHPWEVARDYITTVSWLCI